jgi:hypothetical protein
MCQFNIAAREFDIERLIDDYEIILFEMGILTKYSKAFDKHVLINKSPSPTLLKNSNTPEHLSAALQKIANEDPVEFDTLTDTETTKQYKQHKPTRCPPEKELNPNTYRCVKKCKSGFSRNAKFLCRKNKTIKRIKTQSNSRSRK